MKRSVAWVVLAVLLGSCAGSVETPDAAGTSQPGASAPSPSPSPSASARPSVPPPAGAPGASPSGGVGSGSTPAPLGTSAGGRVVLERNCVHRGDADEPQTLTVDSAPGETVGYSTYYSDYSSELNRPDYTTGFGYGPAGPDGKYRATWVVPPTAPPGRATVQVVATDMEDTESASFIVVEQGQACP